MRLTQAPAFRQYWGKNSFMATVFDKSSNVPKLEYMRHTLEDMRHTLDDRDLKHIEHFAVGVSSEEDMHNIELTVNVDIYYEYSHDTSAVSTPSEGTYQSGYYQRE
jgi:hypothetical protein